MHQLTVLAQTNACLKLAHYLHVCVCTLCIRMCGCLCVRLRVLYVHLCVRLPVLTFVCTSACMYICVSVYVLLCICTGSFKLSMYICMYIMCLSVCLCTMQPSPSTVLVCPATQDPPDRVLSICLCACRPTASSLGRCTREFTACQRLSPQLWTSRTMSRGSEPCRAG